MQLGNLYSFWRSVLAVGLMLAAVVTLSSPVLHGQENEAGAKQEQELADEEKERAEQEIDPFAVPEDASVEELFAFAKNVKRMQAPKRDSNSRMEHAKKVYSAIIAATDLIIAQSDVEEEQGPP